MKKYWAIFKIQVINSLAYPGEVFWRSLAIVLFLWVFTYLWRVAFGDNLTLAGLTFKDTIWYLMLAETIELSRPRFSQEIAASVKDGSIAYLLSKPYDFLLYQMSVSGGDTVFRMVLTFIFGSALVWRMQGAPPSSVILGLPLTLIAILGGWLINFCLTALIGLAAFVTEEIAPFEWIYQKFIFILGGMMIPLDFYPEWLQKLSHATPFASMMYGPARLFVSPNLERFISLLTTQILWIIGLGLLVTIAYQRGMRRLAINGG